MYHREEKNPNLFKIISSKRGSIYGNVAQKVKKLDNFCFFVRLQSAVPYMILSGFKFHSLADSHTLLLPTLKWNIKYKRSHSTFQKKQSPLVGHYIILYQS